MALNKSQILSLYNALNTTERQTLLAASAIALGTDRPEDTAACVLLVLQQLSK